MAIASKTLDRHLHKVLATHSGTRIFAHATFLAGHRYDIRDPKQAIALLHKINKNNYFAYYIQQSLPQWFTVVKHVTLFRRTFVLVKMNAVSQKYWLAPSLSVSVGAQIRGWLEWREETRVVSSHAIRIRFQSPVGTPRLITDALGRAYPELHVTRVFRTPGLATFVQVTSKNTNGRRRCHSPATRQYLRRLFYSDATPTPEVFRLVLADQPLTTQVVHLLGLLPEQVQQDPGGVCYVWASGTRVRTLAPLVAQFLHCEIRVR